MSERTRTRFYSAAAVAALVGLYAALAIAGSGCTDIQKKKTGLGILNAALEASRLKVKALKEVDRIKHEEFDKRYDAVQASASEDPDAAQAKVDAIASERRELEKNVSAGYDFLEAFDRALETAKVALLKGASFVELLPPVLAAATAAIAGLGKLGVKADFLTILQGGP